MISASKQEKVEILVFHVVRVSARVSPFQFLKHISLVDEISYLSLDPIKNDVINNLLIQ
jgi:hypothetical protein